MKFFSSIVLIIWYLNATTSVDGEFKALIYNYEKRTLIHLPNDLSNLSCEFWITSCPAKNSDEQDFNRKYSLYNRALHLQNIYKSNDKCTEIDKAVCNKPFTMSMAWSDKSKKYEFGYEVFYKKNTLEEVSPFPFKNYYPMKKFDVSLSRYFRTVAIKKEIWERAQAKAQSIKLAGSEMEFLWIPLVLVKLIDKKFQNVEYEIRKNNINPQLTCKDHSLGMEVLDSANVVVLYSKDRQMKLFQEVTLPSPASESEPEEAFEDKCTPEFICLTKWPLLPTDQFQFVSSSYLKCSNITTIPLWSSTLERIMDKLDKYLYVLYRISGQPLRVLAGVNGVLTLPRPRKPALILILKEEKTQIETPRIIYKMITFKLNPCNMKKCWYGVLIVIHNGPYAPTDDKDFICRDKSGDFGWEEIQYETWSNEGARSKFIYVCEISKQTLKDVGLPDIKDTIFKPLSLLRFPVFNKEKQITFKPLRKKLYDEMVRLSKPDEQVKLDDGLIERLTIYDNFGSTNDENFTYQSDDDVDGEGSNTESNMQDHENK